MTADTERDVFVQLPVELRIAIFKLSPDLLSLRSLAHASPAMGRVLDRYPLEIAEVILDVAAPLQTRRLMVAVLKGRFSRFPASLSEAQRVAKTGSAAATDEIRWTRPDQAVAAVRSLLATAENIHSWSYACLEHLIRKLLELRPSTLISLRDGHLSWEGFAQAESREGYLPQFTGPPSWVEEQRMIKAFWRLQCFLELQVAGSNGRLGTRWSRQEVDVFSKCSPGDFYDLFDFEREQALTACDFFSAATSGTISPVETMPNKGCGLPAIRWFQGTMPRCSCPEPLLLELIKDTFHQGPTYLDHTPMSYHFQDMMSKPHPEGDSPLLGLPFQPYRKYGFAIWDDKRMVDLGMREPKAKSVFKHRMFYSFRWWSILTKEDLLQGVYDG